MNLVAIELFAPHFKNIQSENFILVSNYLSVCYHFRATLSSQVNGTDGSSLTNGSKVEVVDQMQLKVNELCMRIDELQRDLELKSGCIDRK